MKLIFDQNLSRFLSKRLKDIFPDSTHVFFENLQETDDIIIWNYAAKNGFVIVTKDTDYYEMSILLSHPPKVIVLHCGNTSTGEIENILRANLLNIVQFIGNNELSCLELY